MGEAAILEISELTKRYGRITAVNSLSLEIPKGSVYGLLGPNGSGKTTTLGMVLGVVNQNSGNFKWFGEGSSAHLRKRIGAILEAPCFYHYLNGVQNLRVVCKIKGVETSRIESVLKRVGLYERRDAPFKSYSLGMKQRLAIASALLSDPEVMVLDEPTNGLDPQGIAEIREMIMELAAEGRTIILASHLLDEVQRVCTHFAVLKSGTCIFDGKVADVRDAVPVVEVVTNDLLRLESALSELSFVTSFRNEGSVVAVTLDGATNSSMLNAALVEKGVYPSHLYRRKESLEQKFIAILNQSNTESWKG